MILYDDSPCTLGEGAIWHPERAALHWFDITGRRLLWRGADGAGAWDLDEMGSAAGWVDADTLLIATETALKRLDLRDGRAETVAPLEAQTPANRSNDGRADPKGGFWISTMGREAETGAGAIYRFFRGELRRVVDAVTIPNSICFAPDGRSAHWSDTAARTLWAQPLDEDGWPQGEARVLLDFSGSGLNPDGAVTDADGNLWIAQWGAARVACHAPDGTFLRDVAVPAAQPSCPAFGGEGLGTLFVTTAREGMDHAALDLAPLNGRTFAARDVARGRPEPRVIL